MTKWRTEYSNLDGPLVDRMIEWVVPLFGLPLSELGGHSLIGRKTLAWRVTEGAKWEFGATSKVSFPTPRSCRLKCGKTTVEIAP